MIPEGFILLHRKLFNSAVWECRPSTRIVFVTILFRANWKDAKMYHHGEKREVPVKRGEFVTTYRNLADEANVTMRQLRTAISKLKRLQIITANSTQQSTHITVLNYAQYQDLPTHKTTQDRHRTDTGPTLIEQRNKGTMEQIRKRVRRNAPFVKPTVEEVAVYAKSIGFDLLGSKFVDHYEARGWQYKNGQPMRDWKASVRQWQSNGYGGSNGSRTSSNVRLTQTDPDRIKAYEQ